jgi:restriction system protein
VPIPDFQSLMLPLLRLAADGAEHARRDAVDQLAEEFRLTEDEMRELLPSGRQGRFDNRVAWARSFLKQAGLLETTRRGHFRITERGRALLAEKPSVVNMRLLERYPEYLQFRNRRRDDTTEEHTENVALEGQTPEELLEQSYRSVHDALAGDLLQRLKAGSPEFFERVVVEVLVRMGYGGTRQDAGKAIGRSGDEGIDGIINEDRLGLDAIYVQAKRWENVVGRPEIMKFVGALQGKRAHKGVFITTSTFTREAQDYAGSVANRVVLVDGQSLVRLMIEHNVGVATYASFEMKRVDSDYFAEE